MPSAAISHRPPPFDGWETDLVKELNDTVDLYALSRDMPRLKIITPRQFSVKEEAIGLMSSKHAGQNNYDDGDEKQEALGSKEFQAQLEEKADRMCAALLHLEALLTNNNNTSSEVKTPANKTNTNNNNAPDSDHNNNNSSSPARNDVATSPLRQKAVEMYPECAKQADLSYSFLTLLRTTNWLPSEEDETKTAASTGHRKGKIPCDQLQPQVRILGTMAQTVIFAPSRRISFLLWNPEICTNLMDSDWEVYLLNQPWDNSHQRPLLSSSAKQPTPNTKKTNKNKKPSAVSEKSPLLGGNNINDDDDEDENNVQQVQVKTPSHNNNNAPDNENNDSNNETIYVCHRIVARNVVSNEDKNRLPRFRIHWVLEIHCCRSTGVIRRTRITGVRVRLVDSENAIEDASSCSCCACGNFSEWKEHVEVLQKVANETFGVELEKANDVNPF